MARNAGGGLGSRVVTNSKYCQEKSNPGRWRSTREASRRWAAAMGDPATDSGEETTRAQEPIGAGSGYNKAVGANNNAKPNVMARGTQAMHGPVAGKPAPQGRDILSDYGRDSPIHGTRK